MISIRKLKLLSCKADLSALPEGKLLINSINAYSFNTARKDELFEEALMKGDVLLPDGFSIVQACRFLHHTQSKPRQRVAGWDLFAHDMQKLQTESRKWRDMPQPPYWRQQHPERQRPVAMFVGSSEHVLSLIRQEAAKVYPDIDIVTYAPPFKQTFTVTETLDAVKAINDADPDVLWIGMTAPKQEKWAFGNWDRLNIHCHVGTVGAVFDFFAGTAKRAPVRWQDTGFEWLYRLLREPRRMWRRYIIGNAEFVSIVVREKFGV